jgi:biopolymer transport protein ExbD
MPFEPVKREQPSINLSALIDVVFILLIFVVLAANFDRIQAMGVNLPSSKASAQANSEALTLVIPEQGPMMLGEQRIQDDELIPRLKALRGQHDALLLVADGKIAFERAVNALGDASVAGFQNVSIATRAPSSTTKAP